MKSSRWHICAAAASLSLGLITVSPAQAQRGGDDGGTAGTDIPQLTTNLVTSGLVRPIFITHAPGDPTRLFIIEKQGRIRVVKIDVTPAQLLVTPFLDIDAVVANGTSNFDEQGLLGMAFHPNYQQSGNGYFYVYYTGGPQNTLGPWTNVVARYQVSANPDVANGSGTAGFTVLSVPDLQGNHNGGWIGFKPGNTQGYLYIAAGDGGGACDAWSATGGGMQHDQVVGNGQSLETLFGKILRIDVDGADNIVGNGDDDAYPADVNKNYTIPPSNPFAFSDGLDEIWAYGLRNPWRCSFDRLTGDMYIADVGQYTWEEINFEPSNSGGGRNYGWRCMEANNCTASCATPVTGCTCQVGCGSNGLICPVHEYLHINSQCSVTGGYVYRGSRMPQLQGTYFFADYLCAAGSSPIWSFALVGGVATNFVTRTTELDPPGATAISSVSSFGEDAAGELYICDQGGGEIFKIVPAPCYADVIGDGTRNVLDLLLVITSWGPCGSPCPADIVVDGSVNVLDLLAVITNWGICP